MVLVSVGCCFDQTMVAKTFENPRYLSRGLAERGAQAAVADAETLHAALGDGPQDRFVFGAEKVETAIAAAGVLHRAADLVHLLDAVSIRESIIVVVRSANHTFCSRSEQRLSDSCFFCDA